MGRGIAITLGVLLFVSLGLNIFVLGHMSGRMLAGGHKPPHHSEGRGPRGGFEDPLKIMRDAEDLSPELRDSFRSAFREQLPSMRETHSEMGALRRELGVLMSAEEWDDAAISAKLGEIRSIQDRQYDAFNDAFISVFKELPAAERKRLIDTANERRAERRKRWKERRGDRRGPPPGDAPPPPEDE